MSDASRFVASQYLLYGRFVPGGIATPEGFDGSRPYSSGAGLPAGGRCFSLGGHVHEYAGAVSVVSSRQYRSSFYKRFLDGELFGRVVYRKRGWFVWERALVLAHQGLPSGGDRVIGPVRLSEFLAE